MRPPRSLGISNFPHKHVRNLGEEIHNIVGQRRTLTRDTDRIQDLEERVRYILDIMAKMLAGNISYGAVKGSDPTANQQVDQNIEGWKAFVTSPFTPNTEFAVPHGLGRVPIGFHVFQRSNQGVVYNSTGTPWNSSNIYLMETQGSNGLQLFIF